MDCGKKLFDSITIFPVSKWTSPAFLVSGMEGILNMPAKGFFFFPKDGDDPFVHTEMSAGAFIVSMKCELTASMACGVSSKKQWLRFTLHTLSIVFSMFPVGFGALSFFNMENT